METLTGFPSINRCITAGFPAENHCDVSFFFIHLFDSLVSFNPTLLKPALLIQTLLLVAHCMSVWIPVHQVPLYLLQSVSSLLQLIMFSRTESVVTESSTMSATRKSQIIARFKPYARR